MKTSKAITQFKKLYLFGEDIMGVSDKEQNAMFLYMFTEILQIIVDNCYDIKEEVDEVYRIHYSSKLVDYGYTAHLYLYHNSNSMIFALSASKYNRALETKRSNLDMLCYYINNYIKDNPIVGAYLILNNINADLLADYLGELNYA